MLQLLENWALCDNDAPVTESLSLDTITSHDPEEDEEDMPVIVENTPSACEAIAGLELALKFFQGKPDCDPIKIIHIKNLIKDAKVYQEKSLKQTSVMNFFKRK